MSKYIIRLAAAALGVAFLCLPIVPGRTFAQSDSRLHIVASTPIIADIVSHVAPEADVTSLIPSGADPHTYSPSLAALRSVAHADIAFTNGLLLEDQALTQMINANLSESASNVVLAEEAVQYGARHRVLVEDASLSTIWLGFRADGSGGDGDTVRIRAVKAEGDGDISAFTTGTFGQPTAWISSSDGIDSDDAINLPANAHTHMSWGFSAPGEYRLELEAQRISGDAVSAELGKTTVTFMVGKRPGAQSSGGGESADAVVLDSGHVDIAAHLDLSPITLDSTSAAGGAVSYSPEKAIIYVPHSVATVIPSQEWNFLGKPGEQAWILAQAVLGEHIHGEIDPHLWHDVSNVVAYVEVIREHLSQLDPESVSNYSRHAQEYVHELEELNEWARIVLGSIPAQQRSLITAHDSFGYLAEAYGLDIAGFIAANPSLEPSVRTIANLTATIKDTDTQALFLEPGARVHSAELANLAHSTGVKLCSIYSDTFGGDVDSYTSLMEFNVRSIATCLNPSSAPPWALGTKPILLTAHAAQEYNSDATSP